MPNLKVTKAKVRNHCPLCEGEVVDNQWPEHLMRCTGGKFPCKTCGKLFKKKEYLIRHEKKFHEKESVNQNDNGVDSGDENNMADQCLYVSCLALIVNAGLFKNLL